MRTKTNTHNDRQHAVPPEPLSDFALSTELEHIEDRLFGIAEGLRFLEPVEASAATATELARWRVISIFEDCLRAQVARLRKHSVALLQRGKKGRDEPVSLHAR